MQQQNISTSVQQTMKMLKQVMRMQIGVRMGPIQALWQKRRSKVEIVVM